MSEKVYVYLIHEGSVHEGGETTEVYGDEEKAIKFALMKVEQRNREDIERNRTWRDPFEEVEKEYYGEFFIRAWSNKYDEICIYKYEVL